MTAPVYFTWDFLLPSRPARAASVDDLGGAQLRDNAAYPPIPPEMPYAAQLNQWALQLGGMNRVIVAIDVEVAFVLGNPVIVNAVAMSDQITTTYAVANFTVTHVGAGVVTIGWPAGTLPAPRAKPRAYITDPNPYAAPIAEPLPNQVRVKTWNLSGSPVDAPFVVSVL